MNLNFKILIEKLITNLQKALTVHLDTLMMFLQLGNFTKHIKDIYPSDLILTKENIGSKNANVLDLKIDVLDNQFDIQVYDKTNNFNFEVFKYPSTNSNIPENILPNVFYSQAIRFLGICNKKEHFIQAINGLAHKCMSKGLKSQQLRFQLKKLFTRKNKALLNLQIDSEDILSLVT